MEEEEEEGSLCSYLTLMGTMYQYVYSRYGTWGEKEWIQEMEIKQKECSFLKENGASKKWLILLK